MTQTVKRETKSSSIVKIVAILSAIVAGLSFLSFLLNPEGILSRGLSFFFFILAVIAGGTIIALVSAAIWMKQAKGNSGFKKYIIVVFIISIISVSGVVISQVRQRAQYQTIDVEGIERQYRMYIPRSYDGVEAVPLLLALHGGMGSAQQFEKQTGFNEIAERNGFIVVYPDGLGVFKYSLHVWNSGYIRAGIVQNTDDILFLYTLIKHLQTTYRIDLSRIYMTGHSNGGMMTYRMGGEHAEIFAAIAPVSAAIGGYASPESPYYQIPTPTQPLSVVHVHGRLDKNVLYDGGETQEGINKGRRDVSVNESIAFWVTQNNCSKTPIVEQSVNAKVILTKYVNGTDRSEVNLVTILNQNHYWDNMNRDVASERFYGQSLAEMIWTLLKQYSK